MDSQPEFNPFASTERPGIRRFGAREVDSLLASLNLRDASEDTAPLQGMKDLSDDDSLADVVGDTPTPAQRLVTSGSKRTTSRRKPRPVA